MRIFGLLSVLFFVWSCATAPPPKTVKSTQPAPLPNLSNYGLATPVGGEAEIKGMGTIWLDNTSFVVTLLETKWETVDYGEGDVREGRAKLRIWEPQGQGRDKTIVLVEGKTKTVFGFRIKMLVAHEAYEKETARYIPYTKFTIAR